MSNSYRWHLASLSDVVMITQNITFRKNHFGDWSPISGVKNK